MIDKQLLLQGCKQFEIELSTQAAEQLDTYAQLLVEWNGKMNLTAITDPQGIVFKHFVDKPAAAKGGGTATGEQPDRCGRRRRLSIHAGEDCPTGPCGDYAGQLTEKTDLLEEVSRQLELDCTFIHARAEDGGREKKLRERFDFATARAVAHLRELAEYCLPYVKVGGYFVALKGPGAQEEIAESKNAIATMGGKVEKVMQFCLPENSTRTIVVIRKISQTPTSFPRTAAKMAKKPIL